ncbi:MAG: zinc-ribbon domain-containing protein [Promethearchaeota archaeon]
MIEIKSNISNICTNCGESLQKETKYCINCGQPVIIDSKKRIVDS